MLTPQEMAEDCWVDLELGPKWEKRLTAAIAKQIEMAIADEREACAVIAEQFFPAPRSAPAVAHQAAASLIRCIAAAIRARSERGTEEE